MKHLVRLSSMPTFTCHEIVPFFNKSEIWKVDGYIHTYEISLYITLEYLEFRS